MEDLGLDKVHLKHDKTGKVVLIPQPSDSPNDPYNWPKWKKEMFMLTIRKSNFFCGTENIDSSIELGG